MSIISKLPKKVNEWLVTGQKLGLLTEKQRNDFIAKYISLRQAGNPEIKFRKPRTVVKDKLDYAIETHINTGRSFDIPEMVQMLIKNTDSIQINESKVYHRIQKFVETGILDKVNVEGSKKVLYAKKNIPLNKS